MRTSTFVVSFLVHTLVIGAAMVARIMATAELPEPPRTTAFVLVTPEAPSVPPPAPVRRAAATAPATNPTAAPIAEPVGVQPERIGVVNDAPAGPGLLVGAEAVPGDAIVLAPPAPRAPEPRAPLRVGGAIRPPQKIHHVAPVYPPLARAAQVTGMVILEALIAADGTVTDVKVLRSVRLLDDAAIEAVRQWRFTPPLLNGEAVPVMMTVTVSFSLN